MKTRQNLTAERRKTWIAALLAALALGGCATLLPSDEKVVEGKAKARWNAVLADDLRSAYEFVSPAGRSLVSYDVYERNIRRGFFKAARVKEVRCPDRELCEVSLEIEYEFSGRRVKTPLYEKWVRQDLDWWYLYQR